MQDAIGPSANVQGQDPHYSSIGRRKEETVRTGELSSVAKTMLSALMLRERLDMSEREFLVLSILKAHGTMIVGDIQRAIGLNSAPKMSRVISAMEAVENSLIECSFNPGDRRKVDVRLTGHGERMLEECQRALVS